MSKNNYVLVDYPEDSYDEYDNIEDVEVAIEEMVEDKGTEKVRQLIDDGDVVVIKGEISDVSIKKTIKVKIG